MHCSSEATRSPTPQPTNARGSLKNCPVGKFERLNGGTSLCVSCSPGKFQGQRQRTYCDACPSGKFSHKYAASSCESCLPGRAQSERGKGACDACKAGYASRGAGQAKCGACGRGRYAAKLASTKCLHCPHGKSTVNEGATKASQCTAKPTPAPSPGATQATKAPTARSKVAKMNCPVGKFERLNGGASLCVSCSPGKFQGSGGAHIAMPVHLARKLNMLLHHVPRAIAAALRKVWQEILPPCNRAGLHDQWACRHTKCTMGDLPSILAPYCARMPRAVARPRCFNAVAGTRPPTPAPTRSAHMQKKITSTKAPTKPRSKIAQQNCPRASSSAKTR